MSVEIVAGRETVVGTQRVRRALPTRGRRTVGAWCFVDHFGPTTVTDEDQFGIGPHPHIGLHTVTWLTAGELLHRDTLGSEQLIKPGQLNVMTAGHGIAHAEEATAYRGRFGGAQLWVAQPEATRHGAPAFEHHAELPQVELDAATATVLMGALGNDVSPARRDTDLIGLDMLLRPGTTTVPLDPTHETALVVLDGAVDVGAERVTPGHLAYLGVGRDELALTAGEPARALLVGGVPFESPVVMWWNFVARERAEIEAATGQWNADDERFGDTGSPLDRIPAPPTPWRPAPDPNRF